MRRSCLWIGILAAFVVAAAPARAANQTVTASSNEYMPAAVTVLQGELVTWNNTGGSHNVHFDDESFVEPSPPSPDAWSASRTFTSSGTFRYYCDFHGGPNGSGMSGTVTVQAPGTTPGPAQPQPVAADNTAPALKLGGRSNQKVLRQRSVAVVVEADEASTVVARGTISVPGASRVIRLRKVSKRLAPGAKAKLELRLSRAKLRTLRRAFEKRPLLTARVTVTGSDQAGNRRSAKRRIRLKA